MKKILLITALALTLQGCELAVGAAVGAGGAAAIYDHSKIGNLHADETITNTILQRYGAIQQFKEDTHINVNTFNRVVLLTGEAETQELRDWAGSIAKSVNNVERVYNQIDISGPSSSLSRANDSWITARIKSQMVAMKELKANQIKVVTENGVVYLMGNVSREQAENTVDIARSVSGVQKVIKIFKYNDGTPATDSAPADNSPAQTSGTGPSQPLTDNTPLAQPDATPTLGANTAGEKSTTLLNQPNSTNNGTVYNN